MTKQKTAEAADWQVVATENVQRHWHGNTEPGTKVPTRVAKRALKRQ